MEINVTYVKDVLLAAAEVFNNQDYVSTCHEKGRNDFVTNADLAVEKIVTEELFSKYPEIEMLSEETNHSVNFNNNFWVLDPIDGTTNLIHGYRQCAISLAYYENSRPCLGLIYLPFSAEMFIAKKDGGAYLNNSPIHVSKTSCLENCLAIIGTNPYQKESSADEFEAFKLTFDLCQDIRRSGSAAIDLAYISAGRADLFFEKNLKIWDYAAGNLLVCEAGGTVCNFSGKDISSLSRHEDIFACNSLIDKDFRCQVLQLLNRN